MQRETRKNTKKRAIEPHWTGNVGRGPGEIVPQPAKGEGRKGGKTKKGRYKEKPEKYPSVRKKKRVECYGKGQRQWWTKRNNRNLE